MRVLSEVCVPVILAAAGVGNDLHAVFGIGWRAVKHFAVVVIGFVLVCPQAVCVNEVVAPDD